MGYVFVSHASEDKIDKVKPLVEALAMQGVKLWLDRPSYGASHFNFDRDFIDQYKIVGLKAGLPFNVQISEAIHGAAAVLVCLSRSLCAERQVLVNELLLGWHENKLITCLVDDLSYSELPSDIGLPDLTRIQIEKVEPEVLSQAVNWLKQNENCDYKSLPLNMKGQWEIVRKIVSDINNLLAKIDCVQPTQEEIAAICDTLVKFPIGPMVYAHEIPFEIVSIFAENFITPQSINNFFKIAMSLPLRCNTENFTKQQITVSAGETLSPFHVTAGEFWSVTLTEAGLKSRRTLACFLLAPGAPSSKTLNEEQSAIYFSFLNWLKTP